jgi:hypothetical protein
MKHLRWLLIAGLLVLATACAPEQEEQGSNKFPQIVFEN